MFSITVPCFVVDNPEVEFLRDKLRSTWLNISDAPVPIIMLAMNHPEKLLEKYNKDSIFVFAAPPQLTILAYHITMQIGYLGSRRRITNTLFIDDDFKVNRSFLDWIHTNLHSTQYRYLCSNRRRLFTLFRKKALSMKVFYYVSDTEKMILKGTKAWEVFNAYDPRDMCSLYTREGIFCYPDSLMDAITNLKELLKDRNDKKR